MGTPLGHVLVHQSNEALVVGRFEEVGQFAQAVEQHMLGQTALLDDDFTEEISTWVARVAHLAKRSKGATRPISSEVIDGVLLDEIQTEQVVEFGPQLVAIKAWETLGFSQMLKELDFNPSAIATA